MGAEDSSAACRRCNVSLQHLKSRNTARLTGSSERASGTALGGFTNHEGPRICSLLHGAALCSAGLFSWAVLQFTGLFSGPSSCPLLPGVVLNVFWSLGMFSGPQSCSLELFFGLWICSLLPGAVFWSCSLFPGAICMAEVPVGCRYHQADPDLCPFLPWDSSWEPNGDVQHFCTASRQSQQHPRGRSGRVGGCCSPQQSGGALSAHWGAGGAFQPLDPQGCCSSSASSTAQDPSCAQVPAGGAQPGQVENTGFSSCPQPRAASAALHGEFGKLLLLQPASTVNPSLPLAANSLIQQSKIIDVPITPQLPIGLSVLRAAGKLNFPFSSCLNKLMNFSCYVN